MKRRRKSKAARVRDAAERRVVRRIEFAREAALDAVRAIQGLDEKQLRVYLAGMDAACRAATRRSE